MSRATCAATSTSPPRPGEFNEQDVLIATVILD
jgi:hypothetical protein